MLIQFRSLNIQRDTQILQATFRDICSMQERAVPTGCVCSSGSVRNSNATGNSSQNEARTHASRDNSESHSSRSMTTPEKLAGSRHLIAAETTDTVTFDALSHASAYMKDISLLENTKKIVIKYKNFTKHEPKFIDAADRKKFLKSAVMRKKLAGARTEELRGVIEVIPNGSYQHYFDCSWKSDADYFRQKRASTKHFRYFLPLILDTGYIFQHFYASTLPK